MTPQDPRSDEEIVAACLRGEAEAWETLLRRYRRLIYSIPIRYGLAEDDAADVFQTVCQALLDGLPRLRSPAKLRSWILSTAIWQSRDLRRKIERTVPADTGNQLPSVADPGPDPGDQLTALEVRVRVRSAFDRLAERCRTVLGLLYYSQPVPEYREVARILGLPVGSIGPVRARCLARLRSLLEEEE